MAYLKHIQEDMKKQGIDYYVIPSSDYNMGEYVADYFALREFVSGFTGSAGTLVIEPERAGLWTDSRYFLQAENQLPANIELHKLTNSENSTFISYIAQNIKPHSKIAFDAKCVSTVIGRKLLDIAEKNNSALVVDCLIADKYWQNRPAFPANKPFILNEEITGESVSSKFSFVKDVLADKKCDYMIVTKLDDIAYMLNMRGNDVTYNPVFYAFMLIKSETAGARATLYINPEKTDEAVRAYLADNNVEVKPYDAVYRDVLGMRNSTVLIDDSSTNFMLFTNLSKTNKIVSATSPVTIKKSIKNETELKLMKHFHKIDAVAMVKIMHYIKTNIGKENMSEISVADKLEEFRRESPDFVDLSFETIAGYKDHGAIVHYSATPETDYTLENSSMLLLDSGAQYMGATTDITRTIAIGEPTQEEKSDFTAVLKAHLSLGQAIFPEGTCGMQLDMFAKSRMWQNHLDFGHGTGHGVGAFLNVHEGPQNISPVYKKVFFKAGMVVSNEPGVYRAGKHGVRTENLVYVTKDEQNEFGDFLKFENLTLVPIDLDLVDRSMMNDEEIACLNAYHKKVYDEISPLLDDKELKTFLQNATRSI